MGGQPYQIQIHAVIIMNENIAHGRQQIPGDFREFLPGICRKPPCCFADDLELAVDSFVFFLVGEELVFGNPVDKPANGLRGVENVSEMGFIPRYKWGWRWKESLGGGKDSGCVQCPND